MSQPNLHAHLGNLHPGQSGKVTAVGGNGTVRRRLMELGVVSGTPVRVVRLAPFGDPIQIELRGYHLSLRRAEAERVRVEPA